MLTRILLILLSFFVLWPASASDPAWIARAADGTVQIRLYYFWSAACPHCIEARPHVEALPQRHAWIALESRELSRSADNARMYQELVQRLGQEAAVPAFLFCGELRVGWESPETTGADLERALEACRGRLLAGEELAKPMPTIASGRIGLPWGGSLDAANLSLPVLTILLAALDAFNPCAFFVLLFLLSMMAHQKNRTRMLVVGGIFVGFSGLMYFAFMAAWLNFFQLIGQLAWVTLIAGIVAVVMGILNVKDFFAFKQGPSLSISDGGRQDIFRRARIVLTAERLPAMVAATALLAIAANFYELLCTAGFPMVFTRLLTLHETGVAERYAYLALYNVIYVIPLAAIVTAFAFTLGARKLDERQGRLLKLLSGLMMLELGVVLLLAPERSGDVLLTLGMIAVALAATWLAARRTRPAS